MQIFFILFFLIVGCGGFGGGGFGVGFLFFLNVHFSQIKTLKNRRGGVLHPPGDHWVKTIIFSKKI